jgi:hypothetical protein
VDLAVVVAQADRAQGEAGDRALGIAAIDVLADPEGIVGQVAEARDEVMDQRLASDGDRQADDRDAGDEGRDADVEARQDRQACRQDDNGAEDDAQEGRQGFQARGAARQLRPIA